MRAPATIGARCRRFTLQLPVDAPDGFGGSLRGWQAGPQVWGRIVMLAGETRDRAGRPESAVSHEIRLRFRDDVTGAHRFALGSRLFAVLAASDPDGRRRELVCLVEEVRA